MLMNYFIIALLLLDVWVSVKAIRYMMTILKSLKNNEPQKFYETYANVLQQKSV